MDNYHFLKSKYYPGFAEENVIASLQRDCLKRERSREYAYRRTKQGRFEARFLSLDATDALPEEDGDVREPDWVSDGGAGAEKMLDYIAALFESRHRDGKRSYLTKEAAIRRASAVVRNVHRNLGLNDYRVLKLVLKNGRQGRKESIRCLAELMQKDRKNGIRCKAKRRITNKLTQR